MQKTYVTQLHNEHKRFMRVALKEAAKSLGRTTPNPAVGAVLVRRGRIVAAAHHRGAGLPHAEVECLARVPRAIRVSATLYVTLEPCSTLGRTGPCTDAIVAAGIKSVVVGTIDPNPRHHGAGLRALEEAGVRVTAGVLGDECARLNEAFNKWIVSRRPFVIAKCGMSLDGRLTKPGNETRWITSNASRTNARKLRSTVDAIIVGAETIRADNPRLTLRNRHAGLQPLRVILTRSGKLPRDAHVFTDRFASRTRVFRNQSLSQVLDTLGKEEITSVLIEGGGEVLGEALDARLIDKAQIYIGACLSGGPTMAFGGEGAASTTSAVRLRDITYQKIGDDICVSGYLTNS